MALTSGEFANPSAINASLPATADVELDAGATLVRRIDLAAVVASKLDHAVSMQLRQTLPGHGRDMVWRLGNPKIAGGRVLVNAYILKQSRVLGLLSALQSKGCAVRTLTLRGAELPTPFVDNRKATDKAARVWLAIGSLVPLVPLTILLAMLWQEKRHLDDELQGIQARSAAVIAEAVELQQKVDAVSQSDDSIREQLSSISGQQNRLPLIAELTHLFDDKTWVSELNVHQNRIRLRGFTTSPIVEVLDIARSSEFLSNVRLDGSVTVDPVSAESRFELVADLTQP